MYKYLAILILIITPAVYGNSNFGVKTIETIYFHDSGTLRVIFKEDPTHTEECSRNHVYILEDTNKFFKEMLSGLLAALHSGSKVDGWVNGCVSSSSKTFPRITRLDLLGND